MMSIGQHFNDKGDQECWFLFFMEKVLPLPTDLILQWPELKDSGDLFIYVYF